MRDYVLPPRDIEESARALDPEAWRSASNQGEAFGLRYRRYRAREMAGWPNDLWARPLNSKDGTAERSVLPREDQNV